MTMTPIEKAEATMKHLGGSGKLTEEQSEKFIDLVTNTNEESRARWDALSWFARTGWRVRQRVSRVFGVETRMPYHVDVILKMRVIEQPTARSPLTDRLTEGRRDE